MNPLVWLLDGTAEMVVAYREDRMLYQISRRAWLVTTLYVAIFVAVLVWAVS